MISISDDIFFYLFYRFYLAHRCVVFGPWTLYPYSVYLQIPMKLFHGKIPFVWYGIMIIIFLNFSSFSSNDLRPYSFLYVFFFDPQVYHGLRERLTWAAQMMWFSIFFKVHHEQYCNQQRCNRRTYLLITDIHLDDPPYIHPDHH